MRRGLTILLGLIVTLPTVWLVTRLDSVDAATHRPEVIPQGALAQLEGLSARLDRGAAERMQELFPEGYVFTWSLYGQAWLQVGMRDEARGALRERALAEARRAVGALDTPAGKDVFAGATRPVHGAFYNGWVGWLRGGVLMVDETPEPAERARFVAQCDRIAEALEGSETPWLESYAGARWPVDTVVAVAALRLHDHLYAPRYAETISAWLEQVGRNLDPATGLVPHAAHDMVDPKGARVRGSSQALGLRFLLEIDPALARAQYETFRERFVTTRAGMLVGVREFERGVEGGADVDSGPIVLGWSGPATVVGMGTAVSMGDRALAEPIVRGVEMIGTPTRRGDSKHYTLGVLPVGDAFLVWSKTARPWTRALPEDRGGEGLLGAHWVWRWRLLAALVVALAWAPWGASTWRTRRRERGARDGESPAFD